MSSKEIFFTISGHIFISIANENWYDLSKKNLKKIQKCYKSKNKLKSYVRIIITKEPNASTMALKFM